MHDTAAHIGNDRLQEHVACNLCRADDARLVTTQKDCRFMECMRCGLVYMNPRPSPAALIRLYNDYHQRGGKDESSWARLMEKNFAEVADMLDRMFPLRGRLLDIGCGYGHFIGMMGRAGWDATGIEPSQRTGGQGLRVLRVAFDEADLPASSFDAITAFYVLEHLHDPAAALGKIFSLLKPGGALVLRVPHTTPIVKLLGRFGVRNNLYDPPFHLYDFSPGVMRLLLEKAGFSGIRAIPGRPTMPDAKGERAASVVGGTLADIFFRLTGGRTLLPGPSKTYIASKPGGKG